MNFKIHCLVFCNKVIFIKSTDWNNFFLKFSEPLAEIDDLGKTTPVIPFSFDKRFRNLKQKDIYKSGCPPLVA